MAEKKFTVKNILWFLKRSSKYGVIVEVGYPVRVTEGGTDAQLKQIFKTFDDQGFVDILGTTYSAEEIFVDGLGTDVVTWLKKQVDDTQSPELLTLYTAWGFTPKKEIVDEIPETEEKKDVDNNNIKTMFKGVTGSTITKEKEKVEENIKNTSNVLDDVKSKTSNFSLSEMGDIKLATIASSLGIDSSKFDKINEIKNSIPLSGINLSNQDSIKKTLLDRLNQQNLVKDSLNKNLLQSIGKDIGVNPGQLENMLKSQDSVKILADIKNIDQYTKLDKSVKEKIMENNFLPNMDMLDNVMNVSINLNSPDKKVKENALSSAKKLQPEFAKLFGMAPIEQNNVELSQPTGVMGAKTVEKIPFFILSDNIDPNSFTKNGKPKKPIVVYTPKGYTGEDKEAIDKTLNVSDDGIVINNGIPYSIREIQYTSGDNVIQLLYDNYINIKDADDEYRIKLEKWIESMDVNARKNGRDPLKPILNYKTKTDEIKKEDSIENQNTQKSFIENFDKLDYRIQKVAAESMGFTDKVGGVPKLKETLDKMKEYKRLDEISMSLRETLLSHVETLKKQENINSGSLNDYKEQHGITDQQYDAAVETAYAVQSIEDTKERFEYEKEGDQTIDEILKELDNESKTKPSNQNIIPTYLGLDNSLFQKDESGKIIEPFIYNGDVILTDKKDENGNALTSIPVKFGRIIGNFVCKNMALSSLINSPETVSGNFDCSNNNLKNLVGGPKNVYGTYYAMNNKIETLKGIFTVNNLDISNNLLTHIDSLPSSTDQSNLFITGNANFSNNSINNMISNIDIHGELNLNNNLLTDTSFNTVGNQLPRLSSNASFTAINQKNGSKLSDNVVRTKLQLNTTQKVVV